MRRFRSIRMLSLAAIIGGLAVLPPTCRAGAPFARSPGLEPSSELNTTSQASSLAAAEPKKAPRDFRRAKRMMRVVYAGLEVSFYCGCRYESGGSPDVDSCGYRPARDDARARRIEWEHVVPASWLGRGRECWNRPAACRRKNGTDRPRRACCRRVDPEFRFMEGDPHNLVPAIGELNARRSDFGFGVVPGEERLFGACDFEVGRTDERGLIEPRAEIRGDIARIHFYMIDRYGVPIETEYLSMLQEWDRLDPVSPFERIRNRRIHDASGLSNPYVTGELE